MTRSRWEVKEQVLVGYRGTNTRSTVGKTGLGCRLSWAANLSRGLKNLFSVGHLGTFWDTPGAQAFFGCDKLRHSATSHPHGVQVTFLPECQMARFWATPVPERSGVRNVPPNRSRLVGTQCSSHLPHDDHEGQCW